MAKINRLEHERLLLIAVLCQQLDGMAEVVGAEEAASMLDDLRECSGELAEELMDGLRPYLAAMGVDATSADLHASFLERLRAAADVLERIQRDHLLTGAPEDPAS